VFAVHPVHTEAVANLVGRSELLAACGTLAGLSLALIARSHSGRGRAVGWWIAAWLAPTAGLLSKESGVAGLVVVAFVTLSPVVSGDTQKVTLSRMMRAVLPAVLIFGVYLFVRYEVCAGRLAVTGQRVAVTNPLDGAYGVARVLTPPAILGRYLTLSLSPRRLLCDYSLNVFPPVETPANAMFWIGAAFLVACFVLVARRGTRRTVWCLLIVGFFASYVLVSNSVLLIDTIFAERLWYAPSLWLSAALALGLSAVGDRWAMRRRLCLGLGAVLLAVLALRTVVRNPDWHDTRTLIARDLAAMYPPHRSARLCAFRASHLLADGEPEVAIELLHEAIAIFPDQARYHRSLGRAYLELGKAQDAVTALQQAVTIDPSDRATIALLERAALAARGRDLSSEYIAARDAAKANPDDIAALRTWARLAESAAPEDAVFAYARLTQIAPEDVAHWSGLALAQYVTGNTRAAASTYEQVLERWPEDWNAHANLALLRMDSTNRALYDCAAALEHAQRAVQRAAENWQLRVNLAEVTARCGDPRQAADMFDSLARQSEPGSTAQRLYRERARHLRGE